MDCPFEGRSTSRRSWYVACASRGDWEGVKRVNVLDAGDIEGEIEVDLDAERFLDAVCPLEGRRTWRRSS